MAFCVGPSFLRTPKILLPATDALVFSSFAFCSPKQDSADLINFEEIKSTPRGAVGSHTGDFFFDRNAPEKDSVSLVLESSTNRSKQPLQAQNAFIDETALLWAMISLYSPVSRVSSDDRSSCRSALASLVFPAISEAKRQQLLLMASSFAAPASLVLLAHEMRNKLAQPSMSDYALPSLWSKPTHFDSWKEGELKRLHAFDLANHGLDSTAEPRQMPAIVFQLLRARQLSRAESSHPKHLYITVTLESKSGMGEKRKLGSVKTDEFGKVTTLDLEPSMMFLDWDPKGKIKAEDREKSFAEYLTSQHACLCIKVKNESLKSSFSSGTIGKARLPLADLFQQHKISLNGAKEPEWITLSNAGGPEIEVRFLAVTLSEGLRLTEDIGTIGTIYTRLSNRIASSSAAGNTVPQSKAILESFAALFGVGPVRSNLVSLESHLLFGDSRVAVDRMMRMIQSLDAMDGGTDPFTIWERSNYALLRSSLLQHALHLASNCLVSFPGNYPSGSLKRTLQLGKYLEPKKFAESLLLEVKLVTIKGYTDAMWSDISLTREALLKIVEELSNGTFKLASLFRRLDTFESVQRGVRYSKKVVQEHEAHFKDEFVGEVGFDSAKNVAEILASLVIATCKAYFNETQPLIYGNPAAFGLLGSEMDDVKSAENKLIFSSVESLSWITVNLQKYCANRLKAEIPIYDYLEHGTQWWLEALHTAMQKWAADSLFVDDFEPVDASANLLHSGSVVHLFSISHEAIMVIAPVLERWETPRVWTHFDSLISSFTRSTEMYCLNIEAMFAQLTGVQKQQERTSKSHKKGSSAPPAAIRSLFAPVLRSSQLNHFAGKLQGVLRLAEDPSAAVPQDARFQVTKRICVQMNNVETVRILVAERAETLYQLYERIWAGPSRATFEPENSSSTPRSGNKTNGGSSSNGAEVSKAPKADMDDWIGERFQKTLLAIRTVSDSLINELCSGLLPFIEAMLYYILRMYRSQDDGMVRNESQRIMARLASQASVSDDEVSKEMEPVFEFLDDTVAAMSAGLYFSVFKKLLKEFWLQITASLEEVLVPKSDKHIMKTDQIAKFLLMESQLKDYFCYDGDSLPESLANSTLHSHHIVAAALHKKTHDVIDILNHCEDERAQALLKRLILGRDHKKDHTARDWARSNDLALIEKRSSKH